MRSDLTKAAAILGVCMLVASAVLVVGMRWAIGSALSAHVPQVTAAVASGSTNVDEAGDKLTATMEASAQRISETVVASAASVTQTMGRAYEQPLLVGTPEPLMVRAPQPLPMISPEPLPIQGVRGEAPAVRVEAPLLGSPDEGEQGEEQGQG